MARSNVYGLANLYHEFLDGSQVDLAGVNFASESDRTWGGIGAGLSNVADSYSVNGTTGFKGEILIMIPTKGGGFSIHRQFGINVNIGSSIISCSLDALLQKPGQLESQVELTGLP
ncbi:autotransporter outer membrane beta-barrel domain-containing protein [Phyllobacterium zundukense]|uniref:Autotransporter outer membrane beta-barrel domain-containing protein n=1 Tax=Phyllobacterium zundukense TaxID=1867719 RepID=A0ACD4CZR2_9HYPH|nr:autotransporter outer membrane beta-barrel domain-containing protein [Phyllobacterium zundukense]UXN59121.1 autotransporter outer membrane beta-barrel domain-containing protein [Phyllobacterium zundukense]